MTTLTGHIGINDWQGGNYACLDVVATGGHLVPIALRKGDLLTIFQNEARDDVAWQGMIDLDPVAGGGGLFQRDVGRVEWYDMLLQQLPATLVRSDHKPS